MSNGHSYLITGGTGFIGQGLVRILLAERARRVVVFSHSDERQREMAAACAKLPNADRLKFWLGDVRDSRALRRAVIYNKIDHIIHTAAIKSVTTCELFPLEAVETNVRGTAHIIDIAEELGLTSVLTLSSDKALNPTGVYGASKAMLERITVASGFSVVRAGNIIGSTGSVLPIWAKQVDANEPIQVTDRSMTRFYMSRPEAVAFILTAMKVMEGGEIFVPKLKGCQLGALADAVSPRQTIIGGRAGERHHEQLLQAGEPVSDYGWAYIVSKNGTPFAGSYRSDQVEQMDPARVLEVTV